MVELPARVLQRDLEKAMDASWLAPDRAEVGDWVLRAAAGVTQRANSIWPRVGPDSGADELPAALRAARAWYRSRRLPVIVQVFAGPDNAQLNALLDSEGFTRQSETLILVACAGTLAPWAAVGVEIAETPSEDWLQLWWDVDGRGGVAEREIARDILTGCPALYATVRDADGGAAAVGRLALPAEPEGWGGIYAMATRPDARRAGHASAVLQALLTEGAARGVGTFWLLVTAANEGAQELYAKAGFREAGRYLYRQERPAPARSGC
ncbi:ribosomal-protein-alanine N-acetyltransferase [Arthrobacter ulcerisalmonis]|uniref:Ribosomal-protein-alanine N-acetyltransferase n=2 Tax=Arthrobacter ulcerisalmonis TaxID=2483813 RepID=A0A3P5XSC3_9MICC|nr:ribosomal-protein-alanine N-acetyltransferase [Arthrobacter ulcerisalmonis]